MTNKNGKPVFLKSGAQALANYPHARIANGFIYVSGVSSRKEDNTHDGVKINEDGTVELDIKVQTRAVINNIKKILKLAGADLENIVDLTTFLINMEDYKHYNEAYNEFFDSDTGPSRTTVAVHQLPHKNLLIEIKVVALINHL